MTVFHGKALLRAGLLLAVCTGMHVRAAAVTQCETRTGPLVTPVVELYTSQGCSSCPPADRWLAGLPPDQGVIQAFHVAYWDYIGWADPFAAPAHTTRQRQIAAWNHLRSIYTPQVVLDGRDWRQWRREPAGVPRSATAALAAIHLNRKGPDAFAATVTLQPQGPAVWGAYWTTTENGHRTDVAAGENSGATLRNEHVVRQYAMVGQYRSAPDRPQELVFHAVPAAAGHDRTINLVVFDPRNGQTVQAAALTCH